jgi:hypothetical protein
MTRFLFTFIKKVQKCNEKDKFEYQDWLNFLDLLKAPAMHDDIKDIKGKFGLLSQIYYIIKMGVIADYRYLI